MTRRDPRKEPQPYERWNPEYAKKPEWTARPEEILAWFAQEDVEFRFHQEQAHRIPDDEASKALDRVPWLTAAEKKALLVGLTNRLKGHPKPWGSLVNLLGVGEVSPGLASVLAELIRHGAFHKSSRKTPQSDYPRLDAEAVSHRIEVLKRILRWQFPGAARDLKQKAVELHSAEVRQKDESTQSAKKRVEAALRAGGEEMPRLKALVESASVLPERKKSPRS